jgi:two-component system NtrC family sensor kinase
VSSQPPIASDPRPRGATSDELPVELTRFVHELTGGELSVDALYQRLADTSRLLAHADGSCVLEVVDEHIRILAPSGSTSALAGGTFALPPAPSLLREVLATGSSVVANDPAGDARFKPPFDSTPPVRSIAIAPITGRGCMYGLLVCVNNQHGGFTQREQALLEHLAAHAAMLMSSTALVRQAETAASEARARAEDAARAAQVHAVLANTARVLTNANTRESLFSGLADILVQDMQAAGYAVYEVNAGLRTARLEHQWGVASFDRSRMEQSFWHSPIGAAAIDAKPIFIEDLRLTAERSEIAQALIDAGVYALALLPLMLEGRTQGALAVRFVGARHFDDHDRQLLNDMATQVALAFRNIVQLGELERRATRLALLARAQQQLTQLTGEAYLPEMIARAVHLVIPAQTIDIIAIGASSLRRLVRLKDGHAVSLDPEETTESALVRETSITGTPRVASHLATGLNVGRGTLELCAAMRFGQRSAGVIRLVDTTPDAFTMHDLDLLTIIARHAGTAVETARLFSMQELQRRRAEGAAELARVTLQALTLADGATELLHVLDRAVPSIGKALGVARARDGQMEYVATSGTLDVLHGHRPAGTVGITNIAPDGRATELQNLRQVAPETLANTIPDEQALVIPLAARDRVIGVLLVTAPQTLPLRQRDRITLERLSASLALALDALLLDEEERLAREREHLLATALTTINHPIFILDHSGVRYANPAAAQEYLWSQNELMEMQFDHLVTGRDARESTLDADGMLSAGVRLSHDVHRRRDGSEFPAAVTVSPLASHDGKHLGQVVSVRNVSQDRRLQEQLRHTEIMVALGELVAGVAHEINNPLTGISAFAQMLLEETLSDDQRESVQLIKHESDRAKTVIKDLLIFARKTEQNAGPVNINDVLEQTVRLRAYPLRAAGVQVTTHLDATAPHIRGNSQKLQHVLLNIIGNAEHAMLDRPVRQLLLNTARDNESVIITATDTGRGMSPEVRQRIFEPFFTTKDPGEGTGLGLSVSYGIIHAHGGTITVESEPDVGSTVTIVLPAVTSESP